MFPGNAKIAEYPTGPNDDVEMQSFLLHTIYMIL